jgi:cysteine desulfurase
MDRVYLDYAATTPLAPEVLQEMSPYFTEIFGNPSSSHYFGQLAEGILEECRSKVASLLGAASDEVIFTASGSEGDNLAIRGASVFENKKSEKNIILITPVEHPAVANTGKQLRDYFHYQLIELPVDQYGQVLLEGLRENISEQTVLVSTIYANNEIGTINPVKEIAQICHEKGVIFHTDAVQAAAHLDINFHRDDLDLISIAAHKFYGPKGVGAVVRKNSIGLVSHTAGGKQEHKLRAGTHNVPGIVGLTKALELGVQQREIENKRLIALRNKILDFVIKEIPDSFITGHPTNRLPNHASFVFEGINGNDLVIMLDMAGFACSSGSACKVGDPKPSKVLLALGIKPELAIGSLRITLGKYTTEKQVDAFLDNLQSAVKKLRK